MKIFPILWNRLSKPILVLFVFFPLLVSADIVDELIKKYSGVYQKYKGIKSERVVTAVSKDPEDGKILKRFKATIERKDHFYKTPDIKAIKYLENGKEADLDGYDTREIEPFYPLFDKNSRTNYEFKKVGEKKVGKMECLEYEVKAKKKSARHFIGKIYIDKKSKTLVKLKGTLAKRHWALKKYDFVFNYSDKSGFPVITSGTVSARVKVFLIISDNITDYKIKVKTSKLF